MPAMLDPGLKQIDAVQLANAWVAARTHPVIATCVKITHNLAMGCGVTASGGGLGCGTSNSELCALAYSALQWLLTAGVVPITFQRQAGGKCTMVIPVPEAVTLYVRVTEAGSTEYEGRLVQRIGIVDAPQWSGRGNDSQQSGRVFVWAKGNDLPTMRGTLTSPISQLESTERLLNYVTSRVVIAESIRSNPHYVSQSRTKPNNDTDGVMWNVPDEVVLSAEQLRVSGVEAVQRHQFQAHTAAWASGGVTTGGGYDLDEQTLPREHFIAAERELVRQTLPESALSQLHHLVAQSEEHIYRVFGLPVSVTKGNSNTSRQSELEQHVLNTNMQTIRSKVQDFLNDAVTLSASLPDQSNAAEADTQTFGFTAQADPVDEGMPPHVVVLGAMLVPHETLFQLHDHGVVDHEEMAKLLRRSVGLSAEDGPAAQAGAGRKRRRATSGSASGGSPPEDDDTIAAVPHKARRRIEHANRHG